MSFIRTVKVKGYEYLAEVENYRDGGKVRQRYIRYIGPKGSGRELVTTATKPITRGSKPLGTSIESLDFDSSASVMLSKRYPTPTPGLGTKEVRVVDADTAPVGKPKIKARKAKAKELVTTGKAKTDRENKARKLRIKARKAKLKKLATTTAMEIAASIFRSEPFKGIKPLKAKAKGKLVTTRTEGLNAFINQALLEGDREWAKRKK